MDPDRRLTFEAFANPTLASAAVRAHRGAATTMYCTVVRALEASGIRRIVL
jgi:hypothetical protein